MSNSVWCDSNSKGDKLKLHDLCHNPKFECQKQITFTPRHIRLEGSGFKYTLRKSYKGTEKMWNNFNKPGLKIASSIISAGVAAETKNPQSAPLTSNILKSLIGGRVLNLTDLRGIGLGLKVM